MMLVDIHLEVLRGKHSIQFLHKGFGENKIRRKDIEEYIRMSMSRKVEK